VVSRTSLTPFAASMRDPDPNGAKRAAQELFDQHGIVVLFEHDLRAMGTLERHLIEAIASRIYEGKK